MMAMPKQKPGKSKQDYRTPPEILAAIKQRFAFRHFDFDLAADYINTVGGDYHDEDVDSLSMCWSALAAGLEAEGSLAPNFWLNPPYSHITPWAKKCADFSKNHTPGRIFFLVPASIGSDWFVNHVKDNAYVIALQKRVTFVGCDAAYPKDLILCLFDSGIHGFETWNWRDLQTK